MPEEQKPNNEVDITDTNDAGPGIEEEQDQYQGLKKHLSHDGLFKFAFDNKNIAESFARENLPAEITKDLDFSSMTQDKDTFIDQTLSRCYSDVLYHIRFRENPAVLYFLFEHKSWEPEFSGVQLLKNMTHIWEKHVSKHKGIKKLPVIIPLLIYHGEYPWKADTSFLSLFDNPGILAKYIPAFNYELYDVSHMPEERIIKGEVELRIVLMALRYVFHPEIMSRLKDIFQLFRELPGKAEFNRYLELLLIYLGSNIRDVEPAQLQEAVTAALEEGGAIMGTVFQKLMEQGREIGVKEGKELGVKEGKELGVIEGEEKNKLKVAFNCLLKGMDIRTIADITELPVERIESLRNAVQHEKAA